MKTLIKIDRLAAWVLLFGIILYFITGFGMVKGFISPSFSSKIHLSYLTYIVAVAFVVHTSYAISMAMRRWGMWNYAGKLALFAIYITLFGLLIYANGYQKKPVTASNQSNNISASTLSTLSSANNQKTFTLQELTKYNGKNGQPAYVAVDGIVYDLSTVFFNGNHQGYEAGLDQSAAFHSQHSTSILSRFPIVGKL